MTTATLDDKSVIQQRFTFPPSKREFTNSDSGKEIHYVPTNNLPERGSLKVEPSSLAFEFTYPIQEDTDRKVFGPDITFFLGKNTRRIVTIDLKFAEGDFSAMMQRLNDLKGTVATMAKNAPRPTIRKGYELTLEKIETFQEALKSVKQQVIEDWSENTKPE